MPSVQEELIVIATRVVLLSALFRCLIQAQCVGFGVHRTSISVHRGAVDVVEQPDRVLAGRREVPPPSLFRLDRATATEHVGCGRAALDHNLDAGMERLGHRGEVLVALIAAGEVRRRLVGGADLTVGKDGGIELRRLANFAMVEPQAGNHRSLSHSSSLFCVDDDER